MQIKETAVTYKKELYEKYYGRMMGVCLRYTTNRDEAGEISWD